MICDRCKHAGFIGGYPDGDMFDCLKSGDPGIPFNIELDTEECPCFEEADE